MSALPGRACNGCTACCVLPEIEAEGFSKPANTVCSNCTGSGCAIYDLRPAACREFECGWRVLPFIPETLKPDVSGVLVAPEETNANALKFIFVNDASLGNVPLLECIAGLVHSGVPVFAGVPGAPGQHAIKALLNPHLARAVEAQDGVAVANALASVVAALRA